MTTDQDSISDADTLFKENRGAVAKSLEKQIEEGVPQEQLRLPPYSYRGLGRHSRIRVKLGRVDAILAAETGWLSRACLSVLDGELSGFLDAVRVQSRESRGASGPSGSRPSSTGFTKTPSPTKEDVKKRVKGKSDKGFRKKQELHN